MKIGWIDTANQIHNSWYRDTAVGLFFQPSGRFYGLIIPSKYKLKIREKLSCFEDSIVIGNLQAYLVYLCCINLNFNLEIGKTFLCSDFQPINAYHKYLQKCFSSHGKMDLFYQIKFVQKPKEIKSEAHPKVKKLYKRRRNPNYTFGASDYEEFIDYFNAQSIKRKGGKG